MSKAKSTMAATESVYASRPWLNHYNFWTPPHMNYPRRPLHEILRITAAEVPDRPATAFLGQHLTFIQLRDQADRFATALSRLGTPTKVNRPSMIVAGTARTEWRSASSCPSFVEISISR